MTRPAAFLGGVLLVLAAAAGPARAQAPAGATVETTVLVPTMHCVDCARHMAKYVYKVEHVKAVRVDPEAKVLFVTPFENQKLSPRAVWEAIERARHRPSELRGPDGVFTRKPGR